MAQSQNPQCDGCSLEYEAMDLMPFSTGKGTTVDLCERCIRRAVLLAIKQGIFVLRMDCTRCIGKGCVNTPQGWVPCPTCQ